MALFSDVALIPPLRTHNKSRYFVGKMRLVSEVSLFLSLSLSLSLSLATVSIKLMERLCDSVVHERKLYGHGLFHHLLHFPSFNERELWR